MKAILLATSLVAVPALAGETSAPFIARQPLGLKQSAPVCEDRMPPLTSALSEPLMAAALHKMRTIEDGIATIGNRQRLLTEAMDLLKPLPMPLVSAVKVLWLSATILTEKTPPLIVREAK